VLKRQERKRTSFCGKAEGEGSFEKMRVSRRMWARLLKSMED
jgi:methylmalonyl-CoA mutase N-terminal domain/subunit